MQKWHKTSFSLVMSTSSQCLTGGVRPSQYRKDQLEAITRFQVSILAVQFSEFELILHSGHNLTGPFSVSLGRRRRSYKEGLAMTENRRPLWMSAWMRS